MNKKMFAIGAIAMLAAILIAAITTSMGDVYAKSGHDRSNAQSAAINNECPAVQDDDNNGNQAGVNQLSATTTNCIGDANMLQDSDGAAIASAPVTTGSSDTSFPP